MMRAQWIVAAAGAMALIVGPAAAQNAVKIGIIGQFSGPFAASGERFRQGIEAYVAQHGSTAGGHPISIIYRDVGGPKPARAKQLAEDLIVREKVAALGGFFLSPDAFAVAPVITETKTPAVVFNAGSPPVVRSSPYFVRVSNTVWQDAVPAAEWAIKQGKKQAYIAVADYAPGHEVADGFKSKFVALGGRVVGDDRIALNTVDFAPVAKRIAATSADVVMVFMPSGAPDLGLIKALATQGLIAKRTVIGFALGSDLAKLPAAAAGYYTIAHYAEGLDSAENQAFKQAVSAKFGKNAVPDFLTVSSYDGTHILYRMIEAQHGPTFDADAAIEAVRGYHWKGPSGELSIDAATRDIVPNEYIQRVEMVGGVPVNKVVYTFTAVKDPWALAHPAK